MKYIVYDDDSDDVGTDKPLIISHISIIKDETHYNSYRDAIGDPINEDWGNNNKDDFYNFLTNIYNPGNHIS